MSEIQRLRTALNQSELEKAGPAKALANSKLYVADTTEFTVALGDSASVMFRNPTTDTAAVFTTLITNAPAEQTVPVFYGGIGDLNNTPTTQRETGNWSFGFPDAEPSQMEIYADSMGDQVAVGGGQEFGPKLTVLSDFSVRKYAGRVAPGTEVAFSSEGGTLDGDVKLSIIYYETS